jgi:large subunit ribosomal protein L15
MATLNLLKRVNKRPYRRVGRGQASSRGKQSGRGGKGQTARAGNKRRPELRDIIKKIPKRRGYGKNRGRTHVPRPAPVAISLDKLEAMFESGEQVTRKALVEKGALSSRGNIRVKIVGDGTLTKKITLVGVNASQSARGAIEKAGGTVA